MEELINRVKQSKSTVQSWRNNHSSIEWKEASKLNQILVGIPLNRAAGCECVDDLFFMLDRMNINQIIKRKMSQKFKLKPGSVIMLHGTDQFTENSTDEQLIQLLKTSPAHISKFELFPENWEEIVGLKKSAKSKDKKQDEKADDSSDVDNQSDSDNSREAELSEMKNSELKDLISSYGLELPEKPVKANLVALILAHESEK